MKFLTYTTYLQQVDDIPHNLRSAASEPYSRSHRSVLNRTLSSWEAVAIVFGTLMSTGILSNTTYSLNVAGSRAIVAFVLVAFVVVCVMTALTKMVSLFPITNAMTEYVYHFVDYDLAILVGSLYWLAYSIIFATTLVSASNLLLYSFDVSQLASVGIALGAVSYSVMTVILPVRLIGRLAIVSAILKISLLAVMLVILTYGATKLRRDDTGKIFGTNGTTIHCDGQAMTKAISLAIFPFIGVEATAVTAAETFRPASSTRNMPYILGLTILVVLWTSVTSNFAIGHAGSSITDNIMQGFGGIVAYPRYQTNADIINLPTPMAVFQRLGLSRQYLEVGFAIVTIVSANTTLYLASRALFGISLHICRYKSVLGYLVRLLGFTEVSWRNRAPRATVFASSISFVWVIVLATARPTPHATTVVTDVLISIAVMSIVLVWAFQCVAFLSYWYHTRKYSSFRHERAYVLVRDKQRQSWVVRIIQPFTAFVGLLGCLALVVVLITVALTDTIENKRLASLAAAYLVPSLLTVIWGLMKVHRIWVAKKEQKPRTMSGKGACESSYKTISRLAFPDSMDRNRFEETVSKLKSRVHPTDYPVEFEASQITHNQGDTTQSHVRWFDSISMASEPTRYHHSLTLSNLHVLRVPMTIDMSHVAVSTCDSDKL